MSDALFLGVDGGGTKTEFVGIDADGQIVARAAMGTSYHLEVGVAQAVQVLRDGVAALGVAPAAWRHAFFGLPGYGEDARADALLHEACADILGHARYDCGNDMVCGWAGSLGCEDGINLIAGTGSIGYGERAGRTARVGGWGEIFSDEGSAYWIAIRGLAAFSRMSDGRLPPGPLHGLVRTALGLDADLDLCARVMGEVGLKRSEIAALARVVSHAAREGDSAAAGILDDAASELAHMAVTLRATLEYAAGEATLLSWSGGVLTGDAGVLAPFVARLEAAECFRLVEPRTTPSHGAALYARRLGG